MHSKNFDVSIFWHLNVALVLSFFLSLCATCSSFFFCFHSYSPSALMCPFQRLVSTFHSWLLVYQIHISCCISISCHHSMCVCICVCISCYLFWLLHLVTMKYVCFCQNITSSKCKKCKLVEVLSGRSQKPIETNFNCNHNKCGTFAFKS